MIELEGASAVADLGERVLLGRHGVEVLPGVARSIPPAVGDNPFLIHGRTPGLGERGQHWGPRLGQVEGDCAGGVIGHHGGLDLLAGLGQRGRVGSRQRLAVVIQVAFRVDQQGDVIGPGPEEGLVVQPLRRGGAALQHAALERVGHVRSRQVATCMELDPRTEVEGIGQSIVRDLP